MEVNMDSRSLYFTAPRRVEVRQEALPPLAEGKVVVRALASAISPGTEMLFYRGQVPGGLHMDENIPGMDHAVAYPLKYGYSLVGEVVELGPNVDPHWLGRRVFVFHPHQSHLLVSTNELMPLPEDISVEDSVFLPNMETAVNLVMDGAPLLGEQAAVFGQGVVGLLTAALLARFPLSDLFTFDHYPLRRAASQSLGRISCFDSSQPGALAAARSQAKAQQEPDGVDLAFELSGAPDTLNQALALTGYNGRIIVGSWYGSKRAALDLGGRFHRSRIRLISSQVSSLAPQLSGRWDKARRFATAWEMIRQLKPAHWITQRLSIEQASQAYRLLDEAPQETLQVILTYP
jgi:2-desacetyl-2-hydroxyethyl bacteriochlorophyllide A dehydrogenase